MSAELETARALLAGAEAELAAGTNPFAAKNVETHRARVALLEAATVPASTAPPVIRPVLAAKASPRRRQNPPARGSSDYGGWLPPSAQMMLHWPALSKMALRLMNLH